jgi:hypothetical protein
MVQTGHQFPVLYKTVVASAAQKNPTGAMATGTFARPKENRGCPERHLRRLSTYVGEKDTYIPSISAAIPVVASLFALTVSVHPRQGDEPPGQYAQTLMDLVNTNANPERVGFKGFSPECGHGLIDAERTVQAALELNSKR